MAELDLLILADLHYVGPGSAASPLHERRGALGLELALRAVRDALGQGPPDAIILLGDIIENGSAPGAAQELAAVREALSTCGLPVVAAAGNHDGPAGMVAGAFDSPPGLRELGGYLLMVFADAYGPDDVCTRAPGAMEALAHAGESGRPLAAVQHNPVLPRIESGYPYTIEGAEGIASAYAASGVQLSLSGHYHAGLPPHESDGVTYLTCPALCEAPFRYTRVRLAGRRAPSIRTVALAPGDIAGLFDAHMHTEFAYCAAGTHIEVALERLEALGLRRAGFCEHADQLYFPAAGFWERTDADQLGAIRRAVAAGHSRHAAYRRRLRAVRSDRILLGLEAEPEAGGSGLAILEEDREGYDYLIGAVHHLAKGDDASVPQDQAARRFMARTEQLAESGVDILAHPFRYFPRYKRPVPRELFRPVAELLAAHGVAAEINFHGNRPDPEFFALCLELGVKLSVGSDAHALHEVGALRPHLALLMEIGALERPEEVLWRPCSKP